MMGPIINGGVLIAIFAIAAPFIFVLLVISMTTKRRNRKDRFRPENEDSETIDEIYRGLKDLNKRINNLETLYRNRNDKER